MHLILDLETAGKEEHKRFCNPLISNHKIMISAIMEVGKEARAIYNKSNYEQGILPGDCFEGINLSEVKMIIGHNLKFDLLWLWGWPGLREWVLNGGRVWDTQTVQYLLDAQTRDRRDLNTLALRYGGTLKDDRIGKMFKEGITADKIDPNILIPYAIGDVENTEIVFLRQFQKAKQEKMLPLIKGYMEHYLALCEMEYNGMHVNLQEAERLTETYRKKLEISLKKIDEMKNSFNWPEFLEYNPGSLEHVSVTLFGGKIPYTADVEQYNEDGSPAVYKSGAKAGQIKTKKEIMYADIKGLGLSTLFVPKAKKAGFYRADDKIINKLVEKEKNEKKISVLKAILDYRKMQKILKTYLIHEEFNKSGKLTKQSGFIPLIHKHSGAIHSEFKTSLTRTGRLASRNPNVQNISPDVLSMFDSRFGEQGILCEIDFGQLEVVIQAYLSQSDKFIQDIKDGVDFHCKRLSYLVGKPYKEVKELCDVSEEWKLKRKKAKAVSFQKAYGAQPASIAASTGLHEDEVKKIFEAEDAEYPEIKAYYEHVAELVRITSAPTKNGLKIRDKNTGNYITKPHEIQHVGYYTSLTGKRYSFFENAVLCKNGSIFRYYSAPDIQDYPVQGMAADIVALQVGRLFRALLPHRDKCLIINEIHDAVLLDIKKEHKDLILKKARSILIDVEGTFKKYFDLKWNVPLDVDVEVGDNWAKVKGF